jgi:hypothetical protein
MGISAATMALVTAAQTAVNAIAGFTGSGNAASHQGTIANATLQEIGPALVACQAAYAALLAEQQAAEKAIVGLNLDTFTGASTFDTINGFITEMTNVGNSSDLTIALGYMGRIVANLSMQGG